jgi:hypothetical protein
MSRSALAVLVAGALLTLPLRAREEPPVAEETFTLPGRTRLLEEVRALVPQLAPGQRVIVAMQDAPGALRNVLAPTSDPAAVLAALERAADRVPGGHATYNETQRLLRALQLAPDPSSDTGSSSMAAAEGRRSR